MAADVTTTGSLFDWQAKFSSTLMKYPFMTILESDWHKIRRYNLFKCIQTTTREFRVITSIKIIANIFSREICVN